MRSGGLVLPTCGSRRTRSRTTCDEACLTHLPRLGPCRCKGGGRKLANAAKVVDGIDGAIQHIESHGSHHTDTIVTEDQAAAQRFLREVDSAIVLHNASTQFADGGEFGFGAEIGIATGKFHARGPVGVEQMTSFKYRIHGSGQTRP